MSRKPISKKKRFDVFKRDGFRCVYCGATPITQLLHVDHITPVVEGGSNDIDNLCTACVPCNLGKGGRALSDIPETLAEKATQIAEQEEQLLAYQTILATRRNRLVDDAWSVVHAFNDELNTVNKADFESIKRFVDKLGADATIAAMTTAASKGFRWGRTLKYFYGVCWNMIRSESEHA